jgi:hypothetical protein
MEASDLPRNSYELIKQLGATADEGILVFLFPSEISGVALTGQEHPYEPGVKCWGILGEVGPWGTRLIDVVTEPYLDVRWWKVKDFARANGYDLIPDRWSGAIGDIPERYFNPGTYLGLRFYNAGPIFWPLQKPDVILDKSEEEARIEANLETITGYIKHD